MKKHLITMLAGLFLALPVAVAIPANAAALSAAHVSDPKAADSRNGADAEALKWYHLTSDYWASDYWWDPNALYNFGWEYQPRKRPPRHQYKPYRPRRCTAQSWDFNGQYYCGEMYRLGRNGFTRNYARAAKWYRRAAQSGHEKAQFRLGEMYYYGRGVPEDNTEAARWFERSARQNNADAQYSLGRLHEHGSGVPENPAEAAKWYYRAADQDHGGAQYGLGQLHEHGEGVAQDHAEAAKWYRRAARHGNARAQFNLGRLHEEGQYGITQDLAAAHAWYNIADGSGHNDAEEKRDEVAEKMTDAEVRYARSLATKCHNSDYRNCP